jgi:hypothetical protein
MHIYIYIHIYILLGLLSACFSTGIDGEKEKLAIGIVLCMFIMHSF